MYVTNPNAHVGTFSVPTNPCGPRRQSVREVKAKTHLFRRGDDATRLYKVVSGVFRLSRVLENGRRQVISFGYPGDIVGFPSTSKYKTDCESLTSARVISFRRETLENGEGDPALHQELLQAALSEISDMQDHFMMLGQKSASEKIASLLSVLSDRVGEPLGQFTQVTLPMNRADIADFLGLTTETVSRSLTQLRKCRIIAIDRIHTVIILKPEALLALAEPID